MKILWVKSGGLVPLDTGGKIRSFNLLKELARKHEVALFTFYGAHTGDAHPQLKKYFADVVCLPMRLPATRGLGEAVRYALNLVSLQPYSMAKYGRAFVRRALRRLLKEQSFDVLLCDFLLTAAVIPWDIHCPKVIFAHNVEAQIWERHYRLARNPIWKAVCWREYRTLAHIERHFLLQADHVLTVSENDRNAFASFVEPGKITVIPTGVDVDFFRPAPEAEQLNSLVFTGSMDWMPNEDAVFYFVKEILPRIQREIPEVQLFVVGRKPSRRLQALAEEVTGLRITGTADDIRPYVWRSAVYVVPLRIGGGTRIKIFEAMAMGKAIVSTSVGAEGLPVQHHANIILADEPEEFARRTVRLLRQPEERERLGRAARQLVEGNFSWAAAATPLEAVLSGMAAHDLEPVAEAVGNRRPGMSTLQDKS